MGFNGRSTKNHICGLPSSQVSVEDCQDLKNKKKASKNLECLASSSLWQKTVAEHQAISISLASQAEDPTMSMESMKDDCESGESQHSFPKNV